MPTSVHLVGVSVDRELSRAGKGPRADPPKETAREQGQRTSWIDRRGRRHCLRGLQLGRPDSWHRLGRQLDSGRDRIDNGPWRRPIDPGVDPSDSAIGRSSVESGGAAVGEARQGRGDMRNGQPRLPDPDHLRPGCLQRPGPRPADRRRLGAVVRRRRPSRSTTSPRASSSTSRSRGRSSVRDSSSRS